MISAGGTKVRLGDNLQRLSLHLVKRCKPSEAQPRRGAEGILCVLTKCSESII